jgi:hypothetical protein
MKPQINADRIKKGRAEFIGLKMLRAHTEPYFIFLGIGRASLVDPVCSCVYCLEFHLRLSAVKI